MFKSTLKIVMVCSFFFCPMLMAALPISDGLVIHLDANSITGIADGGAIGTWPDLSGLGNDAIQGTESAKPIYVASSSDFNNLPTVRFDGVDDWMNLPDVIDVDSFTLFLVGKFNANGFDQYFISGQPGSGDSRLRIAEYYWSGVTRIRVGATDYTVGSKDTNVHLYVVNSVSNAWEDGNFYAGQTNTSTLTPTLSLGSYNEGTKDFLNGDIAEVILYNRVLTEEENNQIGFYLAVKYDIDTSYLPPQAVLNPVPEQGEVNVSPDTLLRWDVSPEISSPVFDVYLDIDSNGLQLVSSGQTLMEFDPLGPNSLPYAQKVLWRIDVQGFPEPGPVWNFIIHTVPLMSLNADLNVDGVVDINDLRLLTIKWLSDLWGIEDIEPDGKVNMKDHAILALEYKEEALLPSSYVISQGGPNDFNLFVDGTAAAIVTELNDFTVCHIAAALLADDIERVCGTRPLQVQDTNGLTGNAVFVATLGKSTLVDSLTAEGKLDVNDVTGQWETFILQVVDEPVAGIDKGLFIVGSCQRRWVFHHGTGGPTCL